MADDQQYIRAFPILCNQLTFISDIHPPTYFSAMADKTKTLPLPKWKRAKILKFYESLVKRLKYRENKYRSSSKGCSSCNQRQRQVDITALCTRLRIYVETSISDRTRLNTQYDHWKLLVTVVHTLQNLSTSISYLRLKVIT